MNIKGIQSNKPEAAKKFLSYLDRLDKIFEETEGLEQYLSLVFSHILFKANTTIYEISKDIKNGTLDNLDIGEANQIRNDLIETQIAIKLTAERLGVTVPNITIREPMKV